MSPPTDRNRGSARALGKLGTVSADPAGGTRLLGLVRDHDHARLVSSDPPVVEVTFRCAGDELRVLLDDALDVLDVDVRA